MNKKSCWLGEKYASDCIFFWRKLYFFCEGSISYIDKPQEDDRIRSGLKEGGKH